MLFDSEFETQIKFLESKSIAHSSLANELVTQCLAHRSCTTNAGLIMNLQLRTQAKVERHFASPIILDCSILQ